MSDIYTPDVARCFRVPVTAESYVRLVFPIDMQFCNIVVNATGEVNASYWSGANVEGTPVESIGDLTETNDTRKLPLLAANVSIPVPQSEYYNVLHLRFTAPFTGIIYVFNGKGIKNNLTTATHGALEL